VIDEAKRKRYAAARKAKRAATKAATPAPLRKKSKGLDGRKGSKWTSGRKLAAVKTATTGNGAADEPWMAGARAVHSVAAKLGPTAVRYELLTPSRSERGLGKRKRHCPKPKGGDEQYQFDIRNKPHAEKLHIAIVARQPNNDASMVTKRLTNC
jgi:hypothetical protein